MTNLEAKHASGTGLGFAKGKVDPREAGWRGGIASGITRRLAPQRALEAKVLESRNGAAAVRLLELRMRRDQALEREIIERDGRVMWLMDEEDRLRAEDQAERGRIAALREECRELEAREAELRRSLETDDGVRAWLELVGEERAFAAAIELGWADADDDDDEAA
jgi:hypothetical protein